MKTLILWLVIVLVLSVYPFEGSGMRFAYADKVLHFIIYGITSVLLYTVLVGMPSFKRWALVLSVIIASAYGLSMEALQGAVATRDFSLLDAAANTLGAISGAIFIIVRRRKR